MNHLNFVNLFLSKPIGSEDRLMRGWQAAAVLFLGRLDRLLVNGSLKMVILNIKIRCPEPSEQTAMAAVPYKTSALKQVMMQKLLAGRNCLP